MASTMAGRRGGLLTCDAMATCCDDCTAMRRTRRDPAKRNVLLSDNVL
ncbi:hypothetical protein HW555_006536 [Spodoptera exigua]|uniref:Uncharacterized protein n=1 Tax=Spodoptera exigua TaxID=7107 RepID=A0A835L4G6_SPOEX|nr:hypothetical protein HW555_006536 [Spodoptera exigua]